MVVGNADPSLRAIQDRGTREGRYEIGRSRASVSRSERVGQEVGECTTSSKLKPSRYPFLAVTLTALKSSRTI